MSERTRNDMADDAPGPIDVVLIEFGDGTDGASSADALGELLDLGVISLYDIAVISCASDGAITRSDPGSSALGAYAAFAGARSDLFDADDIEQAGQILEPGTSALMLAYENAWARRFVSAAHGEGGRMIASERIPAQVLMDALDAAEAAEQE